MCSHLSKLPTVVESIPIKRAKFFWDKPWIRLKVRIFSPRLLCSVSKGTYPRNSIILGIKEIEGSTRLFSQNQIVVSSTPIFFAISFWKSCEKTGIQCKSLHTGSQSGPNDCRPWRAWKYFCGPYFWGDPVPYSGQIFLNSSLPIALVHDIQTDDYEFWERVNLILT